MSIFDHAFLLFVSFLANALSALAGGGAGLLQLPILIFLGLAFPVALATHKIAAVALGVGATLRHLRASTLERRFALLLLVSGLPGVILGANVILRVPNRSAEIALGILTLGLALYSLAKPQLGQTLQVRHRDRRGYLLGAIVLFFLGILNGSLTSGSGLFVTIWQVHWFGLDYKRAVAYTMILVGLFWNGAGAITLGLIGEIRWEWLPALISGALIGGYLGAHIGLTKGNRLIKRSFEILTLLVAVKLIAG